MDEPEGRIWGLEVRNEEVSRAFTRRSLGVRARTVASFFGRRVLGWLAAGACASILSGGVELAIAMFMQLLLRSLGLLAGEVKLPSLIAGLVPSTTLVAAGLVVIAMLRAVANFLITQSAVQSLEAMNARLRRLAVYDMLLRGRRVVSASRLNSLVGDSFPKTGTFAYFTALVFGQTLQVSVLAGILLITAPREAAIGLLGLGCVGVLILRINRRIRRVAGVIPAEHRVLTAGIERIARNVLLVRTLRTQDREYDQLLRAVNSSERHAIEAGRLQSVASSSTPLLGTLLLTAIILISQRVFKSPGIVLIAFLYLYIRFVQAVAQLSVWSGGASQFFPQFRISLEYFTQFESREVVRALGPAPDDARSAAAASGHAAEGAPEIELKGVSFGYQPGELVLRDISLRVGAGAQFGIVGSSGSGKSTLLALILGVLEPVAGEVRIGGRSAQEYFESDAARIGYVGAESFLIAGTIEENLLYGCRRQVTRDDMREALRAAQLGRLVERLPGGLAYRLNEDGSGLSAGRKQRLCLARALLNSPEVLVLDEVTATLDEATELEIAEALTALRGRCTTLIVSHRPGILRHADVVLPLEQVSRSDDRQLDAADAVA